MRISLDPYNFENYDVNVISRNGTGFYHVDSLFNSRIKELNCAEEFEQLSPVERRGLVRFLDDGIDWFAE